MRERQNPCQEKIARIFLVIRAQISSSSHIPIFAAGPPDGEFDGGWGSSRSARGADENARLRLNPIVDLPLQFPGSAFPSPALVVPFATQPHLRRPCWS